MNIRKTLSIILVVVWMSTIFYFSHQQGTGSSNMSKKVSMTIINIYDIKNDMTQQEKENAVEIIEPIIRKLAHYTIYITGGILILNAVNVFGVKIKYAIICSATIGIMYAITDEIHQLFVNGRSGRIEDVLIDTIGILTGITLYLTIKKIIDIILNKGGERNEHKSNRNNNVGK